MKEIAEGLNRIRRVIAEQNLTVEYSGGAQAYAFEAGRLSGLVRAYFILERVRRDAEMEKGKGEAE